MEPAGRNFQNFDLVIWLFDARREEKGDFPLLQAKKKRSFAFGYTKKSQNL